MGTLAAVAALVSLNAFSFAEFYEPPSVQVSDGRVSISIKSVDSGGVSIPVGAIGAIGNATEQIHVEVPLIRSPDWTDQRILFVGVFRLVGWEYGGAGFHMGLTLEDIGHVVLDSISVSVAKTERNQLYMVDNASGWTITNVLDNGTEFTKGGLISVPGRPVRLENKVDPSPLVILHDFVGGNRGFGRNSLLVERIPKNFQSYDAYACSCQGQDNHSPLCVRVCRFSVGFPKARPYDWIVFPGLLVLGVAVSFVLIDWVTEPRERPDKEKKRQTRAGN